MSPCLRPLPYLLPGVLCAAMIAHAQDTQADPLQIESNVRLEYAEVLRVAPVHTPAVHCSPLSTPPPAHRTETNAANVMLPLNTRPAQANAPETSPSASECPPAQNGDAEPRVVYDVDYVLRGIKYRSRLPYDPGNRLQVQILVTPVLPPTPPEPESPH